MLLAASVETTAGTIPVKLRNLSEQGALIVGAGLPPEGSEVTFCRNDLRVLGRIAWVDGSNAGLAFLLPLEPRVVLRNIPRPRPPRVPAYRRPGLTSPPPSPAEKALAASWGTKLLD